MTASLRPLSDVSTRFWQDWDTLNSHCCNHHPLLQARMARLLIEYFPARLEAITVMQDGAPAAVMLIKHTDRRWRLVKTGYLPAQSQIALAHIHPGCHDLRRKLFRALPPTTQRLDLLFVDSLYQSTLTEAEGAERSVRGKDMTISLDGEFKAYWDNRPKTLKKNISRYTNRVKREIGSFRLEVITAPAMILSAVDRYGVLESAGWKGASGTALHPANQQGRFYRALLHQYAQTNEAIVFELYHDNRLVASRLTIHNSKMLVILKTTFNEDYRRYAVGRLLLYRVIEHLFMEGTIEQIAFYTNATPEQLEWATESRPIYNVSFYRHPCSAKVRQLLTSLRNR